MHFDGAFLESSRRDACFARGHRSTALHAYRFVAKRDLLFDRRANDIASDRDVTFLTYVCGDNGLAPDSLGFLVAEALRGGS